MNPSASIEIHYTPDRRLYSSAMKACARAFPLWPNRFLAIVISGFIGFGVATGGIVIAVLILRGLGLWESHRSFMAFGPIVTAVLYYGALQWLHSLNVRVLENSEAVMLPTHATLSEKGVSLRTDQTSWHLQWDSIDSVLSFKRGFGFKFGNLVFPIPDSALPEGQEKSDILGQTRAWLETHR